MLAPLPVSVTLPPAQTDAKLEVADTVGRAFTNTVLVAVLLHPLALVHVTV